MSVLFDTNVLIDVLRGHAAAQREIQARPISAISRITWIEVMAGAKDASDEHRTGFFLSRWPVLELDVEVSTEAARVRRDLRLKLPDAVILATARIHRLTLVTRNIKDFPEGTRGVRVPYTL